MVLTIQAKAAVITSGFTPILSASPPAMRDMNVEENHTILIRIPVTLTGTPITFWK
jgi:hypothetical protein